jgi:polyisoprenoid-binding protein YceI
MENVERLMLTSVPMKTKFHLAAVACLLISLSGLTVAQPPTPATELVLQLDPAQTSAKIVLPTTFHTVDGTFSLRRGTVHFDPASGKASGEIVFDATSGKTGNGSRDHKMHKEILESERYPDITFRPDRAEGRLPASGSATLKVHGLFGLHGSEHEMTIPVEVSLSTGAWTANTTFQVPYIKWGLKNPSVFIARVRDTVEVQIQAAGGLTQ